MRRKGFRRKVENKPTHYLDSSCYFSFLMKDVLISDGAPSFSEGLSPFLVMPVSVSPNISVYVF